jgi:ABC-type oligopeptide transport system substrate-binding subunit
LQPFDDARVRKAVFLVIDELAISEELSYTRAVSPSLATIIRARFEQDQANSGSIPLASQSTIGLFGTSVT